MRTNEIKKTVEQLVRIEYVAEDGTIFYNEEECKKYEESALFAVKKELKKMHSGHIYQDSLTGEGSDCELEIFDIQTEKDLENLRRYLYLEMSKNGASEKTIKDCFTSEDGGREFYVVDGVTTGHEVMIFWSYDGDWVWVYGDGSLKSYLMHIRNNYEKIVAKKNEEENN